MMNANIAVYVVASKADADVCTDNLKNYQNPPYKIEGVFETSNAYAAAYTTKAYAAGTAPDWSQTERGAPSVFVVVASR
jgi:hypothetical protein